EAAQSKLRRFTGNRSQRQRRAAARRQMETKQQIVLYRSLSSRQRPPEVKNSSICCLAAFRLNPRVRLDQRQCANDRSNAISQGRRRVGRPKVGCAQRNELVEISSLVVLVFEAICVVPNSFRD